MQRGHSALYRPKSAKTSRVQTVPVVSLDVKLKKDRRREKITERQRTGFY